MYCTRPRRLAVYRHAPQAPEFIAEPGPRGTEAAARPFHQFAGVAQTDLGLHGRKVRQHGFQCAGVPPAAVFRSREIAALYRAAESRFFGIDPGRHSC